MFDANKTYPGTFNVTAYTRRLYASGQSPKQTTYLETEGNDVKRKTGWY